MKENNMFRRVNQFVLSRFHPVVWVLVAAFAVWVNFQVLNWMGHIYELTEFPVSFMEGQTTFNAETTKAHFQVLIDKGTLDQFIQVQKNDFFLMLTFIFALFLMGSAATRLLHSQFPNSWIVKLSLFVMWVTPLAGFLDAMENGVSFVMLSNPQGFSDWLIWPYSSFAVGKFVAITIGYVWALITGVVFVLGFLFNAIRGRKKNGR